MENTFLRVGNLITVLRRDYFCFELGSFEKLGGGGFFLVEDVLLGEVSSLSRSYVSRMRASFSAIL